LFDNAGLPTIKPRDSALRAVTKEVVGIRDLLTRLDRPPEPPGHKPGEVEAEDARNTRAPANRGKQAKRVESKRNQIFATPVRDDIVSQHLTLARSVLGGRRLIPTMSIGNHRAVAQRPNTRIALNAHCPVYFEALMLFWVSPISSKPASDYRIKTSHFYG
jgi:hypothetical protein